MAEHEYDKTLADSFPASDPPSHSAVTGAEESKRKEKHPSAERGDEARPTGLPNSDRHATETAHVWEDEVKTGE